MHMWFTYSKSLILNRDGGAGRNQSTANATTISPNMPTQMIVLVVLSIVCSVGWVPAGWRLQAACRMGSSTVDAGACLPDGASSGRRMPATTIGMSFLEMPTSSSCLSSRRLSSAIARFVCQRRTALRKSCATVTLGLRD